MSWWVMEQVSVNEAGTQTLANIQCDDVTDLPAPNQSATLGYVIVRGSQAKVLATSENYILGSTGTWVKMEDGVKLDLAGYATEQYVDNGLADKVDTSVYSSGQVAQNAEIKVLAEMSAKNKLTDKHTAGTVTETNGFRFTAQTDGGIKIESIGTHNGNGDYYVQGNWGNTQTVLDLSDDTYTASFSCDTTVSQISIRFFGAGNTAIINNLYLNSERNLTGEVKFVFITVVSTAVIPSGGIVIYPMVRNAAIKDSTYTPYAPTNRELYEMILALQ